MSVRGLWVIRKSQSGTQTYEVIFSRRYPTVERRVRYAKGLKPESYFPLPEDTIIGAEAVKKCSKADEQFIEERDDCAIVNQKPVYSLCSGKLWPVVCIEKNGLIYCAVPLVETFVEDKSDLLNIPGIPVALSLLEGVAELLGPNTEAYSQSHAKMSELYQYLCMVAPFGTLLDNSITNTKHLMSNGYPQGPMPRQKVPAWRPGMYKGTSRLIFNIKEEINTMQYDNTGIPDVGEVFGSITCKAELEGCPDVQITLTVPTNSPPLDNFVIHSCVTSADTNPIMMMQGPTISAAAQPLLNRKFRFSPPLEQFTLCSYTLSDLSFLPIRGFYQMKGDTVLKLLLQLKLDQSVKNSFDKCEVHLPFYHRGPIEKVDNVSPSSVQLTLSPNQYRLIWNIGQKFPAKSLELFLQASVHFNETVPPLPEGFVQDPFCVGLNSYAEVHFKLTDYMCSGCNIDQKSISLFPQAKYKLIMSRECQSGVYKIWNSHGDVECAFPPPKKA